ncbi:MAG: hypothetical protein DWG80_03565 [Chloroflexi bacterium]|nr:hypothetical protein [Chloroflexota bacterium]
MNVVLNTDEAHVVLALVTSTVLDHVELSEDAKEKIRAWRTARGPGLIALDGFTEDLNEAVGNFIDQRTRRMMRQRGKLKVQA